jgi:hypothetical protein
LFAGLLLFSYTFRNIDMLPAASSREVLRTEAGFKKGITGPSRKLGVTPPLSWHTEGGVVSDGKVREGGCED